MTAVKKPRHRDRGDGPRQDSDGPRAPARKDGPGGKSDRRSPSDKPKRPPGGRSTPRGNKR